MKKIIFNTGSGLAPLPIRLLLAIVLFPHGAQKLVGWFNGYGFGGTMKFFTETVGLPWIIGFLVIIIEFFGPLALVIGFATRLWSVAILVVMTGIIFTTFTDYFFMNWFGNQKAEGFEFFLLVIGMSLSLVIYGAGRLSVDKAISKTK
ncbi:MAG TPA: DoxX family protein [Flavitalea sp.]|nr:DoxX family protein [Flavitalea sp.]